MKVRYSPLAASDLKSIIQYFQDLNPVVARAVRLDISKTVKLISSHPGVGVLQDAPNTRRSVTPRYGYLIYFRELGSIQMIEIITIKHGRQLRPFDDA